MSDYLVDAVDMQDAKSREMVEKLLNAEGIRKDKNLDYTCAIWDEAGQIIATGSCFSNTLRCLAVDGRHQGEGLMNKIVSHLVEVQFARGNTHLFLYTKCSAAAFFGTLGFYEIVRVDNQIVFMENRRTGFADYLRKLAGSGIEAEGRVASIVMNANPFTLGHQYLVEKASGENDIVHLFMVSEDASLIPYAVRKRLIMEGTKHLPNIRYHDSESYIISEATFPSYFQKDAQAVIESHAHLDLAVFVRIAETLHITSRYVGEEPFSVVTGIYNQVMARQLPENGIACRIIPRKEAGGEIISASAVRSYIQSGDMAAVQPLVPEPTWQYLNSPEAAPVIKKIRETADVKHY